MNGFTHLVLITWVSFFLVVFAKSSVASQENQDRDLALYKEYQIKALFLYNFANFVEWPSQAFENDESPLRMCLYGNVPFGAFLDVVDGAKIRSRTLDVIRTKEVDEIERGCQIIFVGVDQIDNLSYFFERIKFVYVLSVGNIEGFANNGGVVNIMRTTDRYEFEINLKKAIDNGLYISSDLLSLAKIIREHTKISENEEGEMESY